MANVHLSGQEPTMYPGVVTRGHRSNSVYNKPEEAS